MMETRLEVPTEFRELVAKTIDHIEQAFRLFFEGRSCIYPAPLCHGL
jgi:hypothetical protein